MGFGGGAEEEVPIVREGVVTGGYTVLGGRGKFPGHKLCIVIREG